MKKSGDTFHSYIGIDVICFHGKWERKKGRDLWLIKDKNIQVIAMNDTINATYNVDNGILTLTTSEQATDEFYRFTRIVKYKNK